MEPTMKPFLYCLGNWCHLMSYYPQNPKHFFNELCGYIQNEPCPAYGGLPYFETPVWNPETMQWEAEFPF